MTWSASHINKEQADKVVEKAKELGINIIALAATPNVQAVLIRSGDDIILATSGDSYTPLHEALRK